ncbi:MAG TPA: hypothetical protein VKE72_10650, partial [Methylocella sp.]|nr:hypothetical protein [Methylocella sp.]
TDGVPTGPPGPGNQTKATFTPNSKTLPMKPGDTLRITILDVPGDPAGGLETIVEDLTTGRSGFMIASVNNGFQDTDPNTCATTAFGFHPEYDTAKFDNFVPWAALQANVNFAAELGHFEAGKNGDMDADDGMCFQDLPVPGCFGEDIDFDGNSYQPDWPDRTKNNATSVLIHSVGPRTVGVQGYSLSYPQIQIETEVGGSESSCMSDGLAVWFRLGMRRSIPTIPCWPEYSSNALSYSATSTGRERIPSAAIHNMARRIHPTSLAKSRAA